MKTFNVDLRGLPAILIGGLIGVILVLVMKDCGRKSEQKEAEREIQYKTAIKILETEKAEIQARQEASVKVYKDKVKSDSINLRAQDARIRVLKAKLANQRPEVIEKIQADTAVLSYVNTLETVVDELHIQNDSLKAQSEFNRKLYDDLALAEIIEDKNDLQAKAEYSRRVSELEKSNRKEKRKKKLGQLVAVFAGGIGLFLGSQL